MDTKIEENISESRSLVRTEKDDMQKFFSSVYDEEEKWVKEYIEQFGTEPSFF